MVVRIATLGANGRDSPHTSGSVGNDVIVGQQGDDALNGGTGKDRCLQEPGSGSTTACES